MTTRLGLALLLLLASPALAQEPKLLHDGWAVKWTAGKKAAWTNERLEELPEGRLRLVVRRWVLVAGDGRIAIEERTETDAKGKVLRHEATEAGPYGESSAKVEPGEGGLTYSAKVRADAPRTGTLQGDVFSPTALRLLMLRGALPSESRTVRALDLPGSGAEETKLEVRKEGERWRVEGKELVAWYDAQGKLVRGEPSERVSEVWLPADSEASASDLAAAAPADLPPAADVVELPGIRIKRPAGRGWSLAHSAPGDDPRTLGLEYAGDLGVFVTPLPFRLPADPAARAKLGLDLRRGLNERSQAAGDGPELGAPEAVTWRERSAVRFVVNGTLDARPAAGEAFLVEAGGASVLVLVVGAADLATPCKAQLEQVLGAIELVAVDEAAAWERVSMAGASLEVPKGWVERPGLRISPQGGSRVSCSSGPIPPGVDLSKAQKQWAEKNQANPQFEEFKLVRDEDVQVDGQEVHVVEWTARVKGEVSPALRCLSCVVLPAGGGYVEVVISVMDLDFDLAAADRVLGSIRWTETR